ncbi:MAG: DUF1622 domain-containing protein [Dehalococcoidales bacterium]|jgi:uncharacterized membrane protein
MGVLDNVALVVGAIGVVVVGWGVLLGAIAFLRDEITSLMSRGAKDVPLEKIRYDVGRHLLLGLEFLIAADIMRTIAQPSLEQVTVLAIIVAIRTVLSFFLTREMERVNK